MPILFHDLGKGVTQTFDDRGVHYYGHEKEGLPVFDAIAARLKFKNSDAIKIKFAIENQESAVIEARS